ncbi:MAG: 50S ribosomal protein L7 [Lawsonibacter sp.]|nr:50S ribosomal protein L7 [Lawsonibacter sp.]
MNRDPVLHLLGVARKAGRLELGEEPVGALCRARQAKLLLLATDAAPNTRRRCIHFSQAGNAPWLELPFTKEELGFSLGRGSCAMLALSDAGLAASLAKSLARRDPKYSQTALPLQEKAAKALQRQRERRRHEKKLQAAGKKPWAPPPAPPKKPPDPEKPAPRRGKKPGPVGRHLSGKLRHNP